MARRPTTPRLKTKPPKGKNTKPDDPMKDAPRLLVPYGKPHFFGKPIGVPNNKKYFYDPNFHSGDYVQHCREGNTHSYILASWGIGDSTFRAWIKNHPNFADAVRIGRVCFNAFWHDKAKQKILNKDVYLDTLLFIYWSKNTMAWSDSARDEFQDSGAAQDFEIKDTGTGITYDSSLKVVKRD